MAKGVTHLSSGRCLAEDLEVFASPATRARGLLKYSSAPRRWAALFLLPLGGIFPVIHTFGMRFSIDILFCDRQKKIRALYRSVPPGRLVVPWRWLLGGCPILLEFAGCEMAGVEVGDELRWDEPHGGER